jgi:transposase
MDELFKGRHFDREIIVLCVRWYLRYKLSFRDLVEMMAERGLFLAHTTIMRWIQHYAPGHARELVGLVEVCDETIPFEVCEALAPLVVQLRDLDEAIAGLDRSIANLPSGMKRPPADDHSGFGPITASAMAATIRARRYDLLRWACK